MKVKENLKIKEKLFYKTKKYIFTIGRVTHCEIDLGLYIYMYERKKIYHNFLCEDAFFMLEIKNDPTDIELREICKKLQSDEKFIKSLKERYKNKFK